MSKRAAIYARLSQDRDDDKLGVANQLKECRAIAAREGWEVVGEYVDKSASAAKKTGKREHYDRLVANYEARVFDALVVWDLDRLTRQPRQLEDWIDAAEDRGLRIVTANGEADLGTDAGRLFAGIKVQVARAESAGTARRLRANVRARMEAGLWIGGSIPYGYRVTGKAKARRLEIEPIEADRLREAAARILAGDTMYGICKDWQQQGFTTDRVEPKTVSGKRTRQGRHWRQTSLRKMLLTRTMLGENSLGVRFAAPVLDESTFSRLTSLLAEPSRKPTNERGVKSSKYALAGGLTRCSCGRRMFGQMHRGRSVLYCSKGADPEACGSNRIDHDVLERYVFETIERTLAKNPRWLQRRGEPDEVRVQTISTLEAQLADLDEQIRRLTDLYVRGAIDMRHHTEQTQRIRMEDNVIRTRMNGMIGNTIVTTALADGLGGWSDWTAPRRRSVLKAVFDEIIVQPGKIPNLRQRSGDGETREQFEQRRFETIAALLDERVEFRADGRDL